MFMLRSHVVVHYRVIFWRVPSKATFKGGNVRFQLVEPIMTTCFRHDALRRIILSPTILGGMPWISGFNDLIVHILSLRIFWETRSWELPTLSYFKRTSSYSASSRRQFAHGLFAGKDVLRLTDEINGRATVAKYTVGNVVVGDVCSTGHEVDVAEPFGISIIVPLQGQIISVACDETRRAHAGSGALVFSPNRRTTRVIALEGSDFHAVPLIIPFSEISRTAERMGVSLRQMWRSASFSFELDNGSQQISNELTGFCRVLHSEVARGARRLNLPGVHAQWSDTICEKVVELLEEADLVRLPKIDERSVSARYVNRAMEYMRANVADIVLIAEVAAACGVSSRTLENAFKDVLGMTPLQVLTSFRLENARRMLLDPNADRSVTVVALACGFRHLGRFSRVYSIRFGELPSETVARR